MSGSALGFEAMKYIEVSQQAALQLLNEPGWVLQQKFDGTCVIARVRPVGGDQPWQIDFFQRNGKPLAHSAAVKRLPQIREALEIQLRATVGGQLLEAVFVGELLIRTGQYVVFDAPVFETVPTSLRPGYRFTQPYFFRLGTMFRSLPAFTSESVVGFAPTASTWAAKSELLRAVRENGAEGVVFKDTSAEYEPGKRVNHTVKVKFVKTADLIVVAVDRPDPKHGSFTFGVAIQPAEVSAFGKIEAAIEKGHICRVNGFLVLPLGKCSAIGKPHAQPGDVIEVTYLYREPESGGLVQPRMMRLRPDKEPAECTIDQFPNYSRSLAWWS